jgi:hypothetical protein
MKNGYKENGIKRDKKIKKIKNDVNEKKNDKKVI